MLQNGGKKMFSMSPADMTLDRRSMKPQDRLLQAERNVLFLRFDKYVF